MSLLAKMLGPPRQLAEKAALAGEWQQAAQALALATTLTPQDMQGWTALAVAQLMAGDKSGYETTCRNVIARFARDASASVKYRLVRLCSLGTAD